ncbi:MAG: ribonuclease P protein component [Chloroflexi bacterium]|nr:ribonuclease P protein component [Chloroflexota bacterium]
MQRRFRLSSPADFQRVRREGKSYAHPLAVMIAGNSSLPGPRFAVAAGKALGPAVVRNRLKRLLREALRPLAPRVTPGSDLLFIARAPMRDAGQAEVDRAVRILLQRARLIGEE